MTTTPNYTMLDNLKEILEEITNEWEYNFVENLLIKREEGTLGKLSDKQFMKLVQIHDRYNISPRDKLRRDGKFNPPERR